MEKQRMSNELKFALWVIVVASAVVLSSIGAVVYVITEVETPDIIVSVEPQAEPITEVEDPVIPQAQHYEPVTEVQWLHSEHPCYVNIDGVFQHKAIPDYGLYCEICEYTVAPRYGFTEEDIVLLAQMVAGGKSDGDGEFDFVAFLDPGQPQHKWTDWHAEQVDLVLTVTMNRVRHGDWPGTVREVVMQDGQYHVMPRNAGREPDPIAVEYIAEWCRRYDAWQWEELATPETHLYFAAASYDSGGNPLLGNRSR